MVRVYFSFRRDEEVFRRLEIYFGDLVVGGVNSS